MIKPRWQRSGKTGVPSGFAAGSAPKAVLAPAAARTKIWTVADIESLRTAATKSLKTSVCSGEAAGSSSVVPAATYEDWPALIENGCFAKFFALAAADAVPASTSIDEAALRARAGVQGEAVPTRSMRGAASYVATSSSSTVAERALDVVDQEEHEDSHLPPFKRRKTDAPAAMRGGETEKAEASGATSASTSTSRPKTKTAGEGEADLDFSPTSRADFVLDAIRSRFLTLSTGSGLHSPRPVEEFHAALSAAARDYRAKVRSLATNLKNSACREHLAQKFASSRPGEDATRGGRGSETEIWRIVDLAAADLLPSKSSSSPAHRPAKAKQKEIEELFPFVSHGSESLVCPRCESSKVRYRHVVSVKATDFAKAEIWGSRGEDKQGLDRAYCCDCEEQWDVEV